jgi:hypothetical protein
MLGRAKGKLGFTKLTIARTWRKPTPSPLYYTLCLSMRPTSKWHFVPGLPNGSLEILIAWILVTLWPHNFLCRPHIETRFEEKF